MSEMYERMHARAAERAAMNRDVFEAVVPVAVEGPVVGGVALLDESGEVVRVFGAETTSVLAAELQREARAMARGRAAAQRIADRRVRGSGAAGRGL